MLEGSSWEVACFGFGVPGGRTRVIIVMQELGFLKDFLMRNTLFRLITSCRSVTCPPYR